MEYCKLQIGCMIIVLYVACIYIREKQIYQMKRKNVLFETILAAGSNCLYCQSFSGDTGFCQHIFTSVFSFFSGYFCVFDVFIYVRYYKRTATEKRGTYRTFPASSDQYCGCDRIYATA